MQLRALLADEEAVSPVIGVILMVAITVILAAVIGTFVLGLGDQVRQNPPQASFTFDFEEGTTSGTDCDISTDSGDSPEGKLTVTHDGGSKISASRLDFKDNDGESAAFTSCGYGSNSDVTAGDSNSPQVGSNDEVRVVWTASGGGDSATLGTWTGPDA